MHTLGKVMVGLSVFAALAALVLSVRLLGIRNAWMEQVEAGKLTIQQNAADLVEKRQELAELRAEYDRTNLLWDRYWNDIRAARNVGDVAGLESDLGFSLGLGGPDSAGGEAGPIVYAFQLDDNGDSKYAGAFRATTIRENQSALTPIWRLRDGESDEWTDGSWRFRTSIPASYRSRFSDMRTNLTDADELLAAKQHDLDEAEERIQHAEEHLNYRIGELNGGPDAPPGDIGLVAKIQQQETVRNLALAGVDRLRRAVHEATLRIQELLGENTELVEKLNRPTSQITADASTP